MRLPAQIEVASERDADEIAAIYEPLVMGTAVSFETEPPDAGEMKSRIVTTIERYPWLVFRREGEILGYASARGLNERAAYVWSVEVSIYIAEPRRRSGAGRALMTALLDVLREQGFVNAFARIALPNDPSVKLFEGLGFEYTGINRAVGFKLGRWHDVGEWQKGLASPSGAPPPPRWFSELTDERN
jgi:phosphinothricin acetyltransferase